MEPRYVDDAFDERDMSVENANLYNVVLCMEAFKACGRTRMFFKNDTEIARWRRVDNAVNDGTMPIEWVRHKIDQAKYHPWGFAMLALTIMNIGKMEEWQNMNRRQRHDVMTEEDKGVISED